MESHPITKKGVASIFRETGHGSQGKGAEKRTLLGALPGTGASGAQGQEGVLWVPLSPSSTSSQLTHGPLRWNRKQGRRPGAPRAQRLGGRWQGLSECSYRKVTKRNLGTRKSSCAFLKNSLKPRRPKIDECVCECEWTRARTRMCVAGSWWLIKTSCASPQLKSAPSHPLHRAPTPSLHVWICLAEYEVSPQKLICMDQAAQVSTWKEGKVRLTSLATP